MRKKIGIITGSGPEAGLDLWQKILDANKDILKDDYHGDLDAPDVTILSVPQLGHSMELEKNYDMVWEVLKQTVESICKRVDYFVIACNTLNVYENKIQEIGLKHKFLSTLDVVKDYIENNDLKKVSILGALPVLEMKEFSVFKSLNDSFDIEVPKNFKNLHNLIYDVKKYGGVNHKVINDFRCIIDKLDSKDVFLACTELPLIKLVYKEKNLIDVTALLAKKLVQKTY
jgi:aspartate racemase